jgi:hypothetical protein
VPLCHGCRQLFLVGDPIQLPATVLSDRAKDHGYDDSLFKRFQTAGYPVNMLTVQYRMHPEVSAQLHRQPPCLPHPHRRLGSPTLHRALGIRNTCVWGCSAPSVAARTGL